MTARFSLIQRRTSASVILGLALAVSPLSAKVFDKTADIAGMKLHYKVALPKDYDPSKTYPAVLAFPPGSQDMNMVLTTLLQNWLPEADQRGYIVIIPAAPNGRPFVGDGAKVFPDFIEQLLQDYKIRDNKFHIAGMSNGGRSAFHIAAMYPKYFLSIIGFPGYLPDATPERVAALSNMCIYMHVGELDSTWVQDMEQQVSVFRSKGMNVHFTVERGEGHVMRTLVGPGSARLFKEIEEARRGCTPRSASAAARSRN
jgi:predicted peptidase